MTQKLVLRGHVVGSRTVRVEQPIPQETFEVSVVLHLRAPATGSIGEYVRRLPSGDRTKEDIDRQISGERDSWND